MLGVSRGTSCLLGARSGYLGAPRVSWDGLLAFLGAPRVAWALYMVLSGHPVSLGADLGRLSGHLVPLGRSTWTPDPKRGPTRAEKE